MTGPIARLEGVSRGWPKPGGGRIDALRDVDLDVGSGEFVIVRGPSGSGKTTLLLLAAGLLAPSAGTVTAPASFGFVFQTLHLLPYLSVADNVRLAARDDDAADRVAPLLERLGLGDRMLHRPSQLSAGERQRAATARSLVNAPDLVLADEPTGNLDEDAAGAVLDALRDHVDAGGAVLLVTHDDRIASDHATRELHMRSGTLTT